MLVTPTARRHDITQAAFWRAGEKFPAPADPHFPADAASRRALSSTGPKIASKTKPKKALDCAGRERGVIGFDIPFLPRHIEDKKERLLKIMTEAVEDLHELTQSAAAAAEDDVRHASPYDRHLLHMWIWEPPLKAGVLSQDGVTQIAEHKYAAGDYTPFDLWMNPVWQSLTEKLPMGLAPNMVTLLGGLHCVVAYGLTWWYSENFDNWNVPGWVLVANGYCIVAYYTLDCMDGKQARRTGSSSPLGQLWDHGWDCLACQGQISSVTSWIPCTYTWFWGMQGVMQFAFFTAQWEEYYTGTLPHATGWIGVTELIYAFGLLSALHALIPDREALYTTPLLTEEWCQTPPWSLVTGQPITADLCRNLTLQRLMLTTWYTLTCAVVTLSIMRVMQHLQTTKDRLSALSKLVTPGVLVAAPILLLSEEQFVRDTRWVSLTTGLALTVVTIKLIVLSMARQAYAALQLADVAPLVLVSAWTACDTRLTPAGCQLAWQVTCAGYAVRLWRWVDAACTQLCQRLGIHLLRIPKPKTA
jgi:ethanolaminephosphotransferase